MSRASSHRLRAAPLRRRLLPLVPVPHHQRADRGRPHGRAQLERRRSRTPHLGLLPGVRRRAAAARRLARSLWAEDHPECPAAARKRGRARVRIGRRSARLADRPGIAGSRRRLGLDGRVQGHRAVVSAGSPRARQRLARDAGRARRRDGHRAGGVRCAGDRLARPVRCAGWFVGAGGAAGSVRGARAESQPPTTEVQLSQAFGRSTGIDASGALPRSRPSASAHPGRCRACGPHPGCAMSTASIVRPLSST